MSKILIVVLLVALLFVVGCSSNETWEEPVYITTMYSTTINATNIDANTYFVSNSTFRIKTGDNQTAAGATAGELWADSSDNYTIKLGQ